MWVVAKIKKRELNFFKKDLINKVGKDIKFYYPKIEYYKYFANKVKREEKFILENYIFCYHKNFNKPKYINRMQFIKGLDYFLNGFFQNQKEISKFIDYCKLFENKRGYLKQVFFKNSITKKAKFISGPFSNMMFEIIEKQKNKLKIAVDGIVMTISDSTNYLYRPI